MASNTGLGQIFRLPAPQLRTVGLFTNTIPRIQWVDRYALGVKFQTTDLADLTYEGVPSGGPCIDEDSAVTARDFTAVEQQGAFSVVDAVTCSSIGKTPEELTANLVEHWDLTISEAIAHEAMYGTAGSDHNFSSDATSAGSTSTVHDGIAELEERLATTIGNTQGLIHLAPSALTYAVLNGAVNRRGDNYFSPSGHLIVSDAGYQAVEAGTTTVIYGTGPVYYGLGERQSMAQFDWEMTDWTHNDLMAAEQAFAIVLYDPNVVFSVTATRA